MDCSFRSKVCVFTVCAQEKIYLVLQDMLISFSLGHILHCAR